MKCYYHVEREGAGQCNQCGKILCKECMDIYKPPLCTECATSRNSANRFNLIKDIILSIAMMIIGGYMYFTIYANDGFNLFVLLFTILIFGGIPYGWSALNKITPNIFLIMPIIGWLIYFILKLVLAFCIGWLFFIIKIGQIIYGVIQNKQMSEYIKGQSEEK